MFRKRCVHLVTAFALALPLLVSGGIDGQVSGQQSSKDLASKNDLQLPSEFRRVSESVFCGAHPTSEDAFAALSKKNIKTIVSVDGTEPHLLAAKKHGIRYVHIPIGYGQIDKKSLGMIARLASEAEKPMYVHCHLGKHRGPAVAAIASLELAEIDHQEAIGFLGKAGTNKKYVGLWDSVKTHQRPAPKKSWPQLIEVSKVDPFVSAMSKMIGPIEQLRATNKANWKPSKELRNSEFRNFKPQHLAVLINQNFREAVRANPKKDDKVLSSYLAESASISVELEKSLSDKDHKQASIQLNSLLMQCSRCHEEYR